MTNLVLGVSVRLYFSKRAYMCTSAGTGTVCVLVYASYVGKLTMMSFLAKLMAHGRHQVIFQGGA